MISDERLAEIEAEARRHFQHDDRLPDVCPGCMADLALDQLLAALRAEREALVKIRAVVNEQAEDAGLWPIYPMGEQRITEAYLQQELRRLHAVVERVTPDPKEPA